MGEVGRKKENSLGGWGAFTPLVAEIHGYPSVVHLALRLNFLSSDFVATCGRYINISTKENANNVGGDPCFLMPSLISSCCLSVMSNHKTTNRSTFLICSIAFSLPPAKWNCCLCQGKFFLLF